MNLSSRILKKIERTQVILQDRWNRDHRVSNVDDHIDSAIQWLIRATRSTKYKGVSVGYSLKDGWLPGYIETTGYIIPTLFELAKKKQRQDLRALAIQLADWELSVQHESGGFTGSDHNHVTPIVFDTGQVLFGLNAAYQETQEERYLTALIKAADFLVQSMDDEGNYFRNTYRGVIHTYNVRCTWALLGAYQITKNETYKVAAEKNVAWTLRQQQSNGFFRWNTFATGEPCYTHMIAYTLRGLFECGCILQNENVIDCVVKTTEYLKEDLQKNKTLANHYGTDWERLGEGSCLTGDCQMALVFYKVGCYRPQLSGYRDIFTRLSHMVKSTQNRSSVNLNIRGAIKGSHPIWADYSPFMYPNWATKFFIDMLMVEKYGDGGCGG